MPGQIDQIIVNLVVNARDAMPDGGTVTIETGNVAFDEPHAIDALRRAAPEPYVLLAVSDTGVGMDRDDAGAHLRAVLHDQGRRQGHRPGPGHDLRHRPSGRRPHLALLGTGAGLRLQALLPAGRRRRRGRDRASRSTPSVGVGTVLVVEDEPAVRDMTTQLLERAGYDVARGRRTGSEALADAQTRRAVRRAGDRRRSCRACPASSSPSR